MNDDFLAQLRTGFEGCCPTCGRFAKMYHRRLHTSVALQLIHTYRLGAYGGIYIHTSKLIAKGVSGVGDFSKAKYWALIEEQAQGSDRSSGYWQLTPQGVDFVLGSGSIKKYALVYNDNVLGHSGPFVSIRQCLDEKFDYDELMAA